MFTTIHPGTGIEGKSYTPDTKEDIEHKIERASKTFATWRDFSFAERAKVLKDVAAVLRKNRDIYAHTITEEMGKPIVQAKAEIEKSAWVLEYYADEGEKMLQQEVLQSDASKSYVRFDPLGIIVAVMPWNFPFWQVFRFIAPAAMAGNVGLLKHASVVPGCALAIQDAFREAGAPQGLFQTLLIRGSDVEAVIHDPRVVAVTLTGSEAAGRAVASAAGQALKKTVLELGGSDPFIVLKDADIEQAIKTATTSRLQNAGQSCIAAKRFIVEETVAESFLSGLKQKFQSIRIGDPYDEMTEFGPLVSSEARAEIHRQVETAKAAGATCVLGGESIDRPGFFYAPTIITNITKDMAIYKEEVFGPVALVFVVKDIDEAVFIANDTSFGLGAAIWSADTEQAEKIAARIEAGGVFINGMVKSDPRLPFGGVKVSGYGRELSGYGMKEFVNIKTVWIA
jgi:succinate-semialdehyde dehydrogenase/glutarate-semialdehyde dehydrogenase